MKISLTEHTMADTGQILGGSSIALVTIIGAVYTAINHKHIKATCCGKVFEFGVDIGPTEGATATVHPEPPPTRENAA